MRMRGSSLYAIVLALSVIAGARAARADDADALKQRLHTAEQGSTLSGDGVAPFYIKMAVQLFDKKGQPQDQGTVEIFWAGVGREKRIYKFPSYSATEVHKDDKLYRTTNTGYPPTLVSTLINQVLHPMPQAAEIDQSQPRMQTVKFGNVPLECIMLGQPIHGLKEPPMGLFPTYCFDPGKDVPRIRFNYGTQFVTRNSIGLFQQKHVAMNIGITEGSTVVAKAEVVAMNQRAIIDADLATDGDQEVGVNAPVRVASGVTQGLALTQPAPIYPPAARGARVEGLVIMHAIIGTDGHIEDLSVVSSPDPDLAVAALTAVRQWTYRPYRLNGVPVEVETTININFEMGP